MDGGVWWVAVQSMGSLRVRHDWMTSLSLFTFRHWRRQRHSIPVLLPGKSHGWRSLVGSSTWGRWVGHDWATSLLLFTFMHWRRKWQPTPVFLLGEFQGQGSLVGCCLWGRTESDTTEVTQQQQLQQQRERNGGKELEWVVGRGELCCFLWQKCWYAKEKKTHHTQSCTSYYWLNFRFLLISSASLNENQTKKTKNKKKRMSNPLSLKEYINLFAKLNNKYYCSE